MTEAARAQTKYGNTVDDEKANVDNNNAKNKTTSRANSQQQPESATRARQPAARPRETNDYNNKGKNDTDLANNRPAKGGARHTSEAADGKIKEDRRRKRRRRHQGAGRNKGAPNQTSQIGAS